MRVVIGIGVAFVGFMMLGMGGFFTHMTEWIGFLQGNFTLNVFENAFVAMVPFLALIMVGAGIYIAVTKGEEAEGE